jgi:hypothetical protein
MPDAKEPKRRPWTAKEIEAWGENVIPPGDEVGDELRAL